MRVTALLASAALVVTSCSGPDTEANQASPETESANASDLQGTLKSAHTAKMMAVDPVTAVSAGLSIASSLKSLFGKNDSGRDLKKIRKQLTEISQQNRQILQTLGQIVSILNNLGVTIRENVRLETIFNLEAALSGQGDQLYETWMAEIDDRRAQRQAETRYRTQIMPEVRNITHELMNEGFGYSAYDSVGHGMLMEFWMSRRVRERSSFRQQAAGTYLAYFNRALDPGLAGSPGHALAQAVAQRDRMKAILDAADARLGQNGWSISSDREDVRSSGRRTTYRTIRDTRTASGNQRDGYTYTAKSDVIRERVEVEPADVGPRCGACLQLESAINTKAASANKSLAPDPQAPRVLTPETSVAYWNVVRTTYHQAAKDAEVLGKATETLRLYQSEAQLVQRQP